MSERLTDDLWRQELEWLKRQPHAAIHQPNAIVIVEELLALRARVAKLETALKAAYHALESYAHDNASTELAVSVAAHCKAALSETVEA